jgi:hypothetical protein
LTLFARVISFRQLFCAARFEIFLLFCFHVQFSKNFFPKKGSELSSSPALYPCRSPEQLLSSSGGDEGFLPLSYRLFLTLFLRDYLKRTGKSLGAFST